MTHLARAVRRALEWQGLAPLLISVGVVTRLALVLLVPTAPWSDAEWYFVRAKEIAAGLGYQEGGLPTAYWPIGYPALLAGLFTLLPPTVVVAQLANVVAGGVSLWLVYSITSRLFGRRSYANLALLLYSIHFNSIAYSALLLTESLYTALLLTVARLSFDLERVRNVVIAGLLGGIMTLIKTQTWIFFVLWAVLIALTRWRAGHIRSARNGVIMILCLFLVVLPWSLRNLNVFGSFVLVSTNGGFALAVGNHPNGNGSDTYAASPFRAEIAQSVKDQVGADRRATMVTLRWISENPWDFLKLAPKKYYYGVILDGEGEWGFQAGYPRYDSHKFVFRAFRVVNQLVYLALLSGGLLGALVLWRQRADVPAFCWPPLLLIAAWGAVFLMLTFITNGQSRYHFPIIPFLAMLSSAFLLREVRRSSLRSKR